METKSQYERTERVGLDKHVARSKRRYSETRGDAIFGDVNAKRVIWLAEDTVVYLSVLLYLCLDSTM